MSVAREWLDGHAAEAPAVLRERMVEAVATEGSESAASHALDGSAPRAEESRTERQNPASLLAEAALDRLRAVIASDGARASALDLLAADALLTGACEAAAEKGPDSLDRLTRAYGPGRLASLLAGERERA